MTALSCPFRTGGFRGLLLASHESPPSSIQLSRWRQDVYIDSDLGILQRRRLGPERQTARIRSAEIHNQGGNAWLSRQRIEQDLPKRGLNSSKSFAMSDQTQQISPRCKLSPTPEYHAWLWCQLMLKRSAFAVTPVHARTSQPSDGNLNPF
ncbi:hypothetical protein JMJ77_0013690 [Colletotrichum scovillei]|uniref:Uncharacterized protein n=1 Tax=Colletotrichum scovillei TaxID=1209932 RepID=A0A9P7UA28_9PEZI|nr:hypothetical protein JMJ77_0013690 [Colletotrichum scovillei]KAG7065204.1 hypothetical protein JMJ78_0011964 [Colletotrichum scovillei]KAG7067806.1 hypothetical protein JMJ76_0007509 [Colletotrichum scovillei]